MKKIVIGILVVLFGTFLLLENLEIIGRNSLCDELVRSWQTILAAIGITMLFDKDRGHRGAGIVMIVVGILFLTPKIYPQLHVTHLMWPLLIILLGIWLIMCSVMRRGGKKKCSRWNIEDLNKSCFGKTSSEKGGIVKRSYVFDTSKEKWTSGKLRNLEIEAVFSTVELDFSQAELSDEVKVAVYVKVSSVFGSVVLYVPEDWNIMIQKTGVFGGFTDSRPRNREVDKDKLVILELEAVFGGGEIKCYE
jgi:predicted membrane protein